LLDSGHDVTLFYSNANIYPHEEWEKRLESVQRLADHYTIPLLVDRPTHEEWLEHVAVGYEQEPERGIRCTRCFQYSLARTYAKALEEGFDLFTTCLTVSPHKATAVIFEVGRALSSTHFLAIDFKKEDGFKKSLALSEQLNLYRQSYCGCEFSIKPIS
jgi:predicted adenine nucleotide alpha hydrolase (AANH) superfamily ATPase